MAATDTEALSRRPQLDNAGKGRLLGPAGRPNHRQRQAASAYLFLAPGFALFVLVILWPIAQALVGSFRNWSIMPGVESPWVGLANYQRLMDDPMFWRGLANTAIYMAVTVPGQIVIGLLLAVAVDSRIRGRTLFRVLFYLPVVTSWVVVSLLFKYLFITEGGLVNWALHDVTGLTSSNIEWLQHRWTAIAAICLLGIWKGVGWTMVICLAALQVVRPELHESAALDGAGAVGRFWHVTLPGIRRTLLFISVMLVIGGFNVFISVQLMTGGGPNGDTEVLLTYMYRQAFNFLDFGYGSAIAFVLTGIVLVLSLGQTWFFNRLDRGNEE